MQKVPTFLLDQEDEKSLIVNEIALMLPYLNSLVLDGFLRYPFIPHLCVSLEVHSE